MHNTSKKHLIYLCLGANLGDKESNLVEGLTRLRNVVDILEVSPVYETDPVDFVKQPKFLNLVCKGETLLTPEKLLYEIKKIERDMGRLPQEERYRPRPIDIDILFYEDLVLNNAPELVIPHDKIAERAFVLVPLNDLSPDFIHPQTNLTINQHLSQVDQQGVNPIRHGLLSSYKRDVQCETPAYSIPLDRVGLTHLKRVITLNTYDKPRMLPAVMEIYVSLPFNEKGTHMSRLGIAAEEIVNEIITEASPKIETLCSKIAENLLTKLEAERAEVNIRSEFPLNRRTPVSGLRSQEVYTLLGSAVATKSKTLAFIGVEAEGMTACPCAQHLVYEQAERRLIEAGFSTDAVKTILTTVPLPTHNQRGRGRLIISANPNIWAQDLIHLIESSMSSETYEILKRPDEFFIVSRSHQQPRFVEDVIRIMLGSVIENYPELDDNTFISAQQVNFETIHKHNVAAEYSGTFGAIRKNLKGEFAPSCSQTEWITQQISK